MPDLTTGPLPATMASTGPAASVDEAGDRRLIRRLTIAANVAALPVAVLGAVLSFHSLSRWALPLYGPGWNYVVPFVVDFVIVSASLKFIAGAKAGRVVPGWRLMAHAGVAATLIFNAQAARDWTQVLGLDWPPLVWSFYVELTAAELIGQWRDQYAVRRRRVRDKIPLRLWITAPVESARVWLRMERRLEGEQADARLEVGIYAAALAALDEALPHRGGRRVRGIIRRQLRAGSLQPHDILIPLGWHTDEPTLSTIAPRTVLRAVLRQALLRRGDTDPATRYATGIQGLDHSDPQQPAPPPARPATQPDAGPATEPTVEPAAEPATEPTVEPAAGAGHRRRRQPTPASTTPAMMPPATTSAASGIDPTGGTPPRTIDLRNDAHSPAAASTEEDSPQSTGDRHEDAVLIWRRFDGKITGREMATKLGGLGWPGVSERNALRIIQQVKDTEQDHPTGVLALASRL